MMTMMIRMQQAQSQKGKAAEKSPQTEAIPTPGIGSKSDVNVINLAIGEQGNKIRQLKADKADKVNQFDASLFGSYLYLLCCFVFL